MVQTRSVRNMVSILTLAPQRALLWIYQSWLAQAMLATPVGRAAFERFYLIYKDWIEAPGAVHLAVYVDRGEWVIDVGANIGFFTEKFACWVKSGGRVIAIEPEPLNYACLLRRVRNGGHDHVVITRKVVADARDGSVFLEVCKNHPGNHHISENAGLRELALRTFGISSAQLIEAISDLRYTFAVLKRSGIEPVNPDELRMRIAKAPERYLDVVCCPEKGELRKVDGIG